MEENNPHLEYRSVNNAAHMCGHDGHTACLLGGISKILENIHTIPNNKIIRFLFQPAEEIVGGAPVMIKDGCLDYVNEIYGMHNFPLPKVEIHCIKGSNFAEATSIRITIIGKGGHGSDPKLSNNPIIPASKLYLKYLSLIDKYKAEGHVFNSTLPMFKAGTAINVVPDTAFLGGSFRSLEDGLVNKFSKDLEKIIKNECEK